MTCACRHQGNHELHELFDIGTNGNRDGICHVFVKFVADS